MKRIGLSSLVALALLGTSAVFPAGATPATPLPAATGLGGPHPMPFDEGSAGGTGRLRTAAAPANAHLNYYGGRVISHVQVIQVVYGPGTYLPQTTGVATPTVSS